MYGAAAPKVTRALTAPTMHGLPGAAMVTRHEQGHRQRVATAAQGVADATAERRDRVELGGQLFPCRSAVARDVRRSAVGPADKAEQAEAVRRELELGGGAVTAEAF